MASVYSVPEAVRNTLSLMHSCGMYDFSGQFAFDVSLTNTHSRLIAYRIAQCDEVHRHSGLYS